MKFMVYNVIESEIPFVKKWSEDNAIEVDFTDKLLDINSVELAKNYDGISTLQLQPMENELFEKMHKLNIPVLTIRNVGTDNIDLVAAKQNDILVTNVPTYSPESIAEFSVMMSLYLTRKAGYIQDLLHQKHQFHNEDHFIGKLISDMTVGIIGTGHIGRAAIKLFKGLGAKIIAYDKFAVDTDDGDIEYDNDIDELLRQADIVDLHVPGSPDNYHLINRERLDIMKNSAILINTARGSLVDTQALIYALENNIIAGAGLDTFEDEPGDILDTKSNQTLNDPNIIALAKMPNTIVTPHVAFNTQESIENMVNTSLDNLKTVMLTGTSENSVN